MKKNLFALTIALLMVNMAFASNINNYTKNNNKQYVEEEYEKILFKDYRVFMHNVRDSILLQKMCYNIDFYCDDCISRPKWSELNDIFGSEFVEICYDNFTISGDFFFYLKTEELIFTWGSELISKYRARYENTVNIFPNLAELNLSLPWETQWKLSDDKKWNKAWDDMVINKSLSKKQKQAYYFWKNNTPLKTARKRMKVGCKELSPKRLKNYLKYALQDGNLFQ